MDRMLEKVIGEALGGSRKATTMADDLETMFEMWTGYMIGRLGESTFLSRLQVFDDASFNIDGYQPTIMPVPCNLIESMSSIGVDTIRPSMRLYSTGDTMLLAEAESMNWLIFTVTEQGHPLKGLRYVTGLRGGELVVAMDDPMFTATYDDEHFQYGGTGCYIDKRERFLRAARPEIFDDRP